MDVYRLIADIQKSTNLDIVLFFIAGLLWISFFYIYFSCIETIIRSHPVRPLLKLLGSKTNNYSYIHQSFIYIYVYIYIYVIIYIYMFVIRCGWRYLLLHIFLLSKKLGKKRKPLRVAMVPILQQWLSFIEKDNWSLHLMWGFCSVYCVFSTYPWWYKRGLTLPTYPATLSQLFWLGNFLLS